VEKNLPDNFEIKQKRGTVGEEKERENQCRKSLHVQKENESPGSEYENVQREKEIVIGKETCTVAKSGGSYLSEGAPRPAVKGAKLWPVKEKKVPRLNLGGNDSRSLP